MQLFVESIGQTIITTIVDFFIDLFNYIFLAGMGKELENIILENNELLATKWVLSVAV